MQTKMLLITITLFIVTKQEPIITSCSLERLKNLHFFLEIRQDIYPQNKITNGPRCEIYKKDLRSVGFKITADYETIIDGKTIKDKYTGILHFSDLGQLNDFLNGGHLYQASVFYRIGARYYPNEIGEMLMFSDQFLEKDLLDVKEVKKLKTALI